MPKISTRIRIIAMGMAGGLLFGGAQAAPQDDWPNMGRDPGGARYSPLDQITPANVNSLKVAWKHDLKPVGLDTRNAASQTTPLVIDGVLYLANPYGKIQALDGVTGKEIWSYALPDNMRPNTRGMGYWPGDGKNDPRLIFTSQNGRMLAVNAKTGKAADGFGEKGVINLRTPDVMRGFPDRPYGVSSAPLIYKNLAITGSAMGEIPKGPAGNVRAWDVLTGKMVWTFKTVPGPGELGYDTWAPGSTVDRAGANVWGLMNFDAERGIAYLPIGAPSSDRYGGDRHGTNLFSGSLVAVNAATDIATVTPEHKAFCEKLIKDKKLHDSVRYSPLTMDSRIARFPGSGGGPEWAGGAMDEKRGLFIINTHDMGSIEMVEKKKEGHWGSADGPDSFFIDEKNKLMCQEPPWGTLYAINVNTGDIAWSTRLGVTDSLPEAVRNTGRPSIGGPTVTAGGLIFIAATDDSRFRAFETATGKEVWTHKMDVSAHASPMTYRGKDGKQYVAIVATGGSFLQSPSGPGSLLVFALP